MSDEPIQLKSNEFWGRRAGSVSVTQGRIFKLKRGGPGSASSSNTKSKSPYHQAMRELASQAIRAGWLNGKRIRKDIKNEAIKRKEHGVEAKA
jgi:hypothetical protein